MKTQIAYSTEFSKHDNPNHPENAKRLTAILNEIKNTQFYKKLKFIEPQLISPDIIKKVHSTEMIDIIKEMSKNGNEWIDLDTYVCKSDYDTARLAVGGLYSIVDNVVNNKAENGFALIRPPGHHATSNRSMGFCLFNNAAIASNEFAQKGKKILIFDHDVHHGNGTQEIFYDRSDVLYQSFHLSPHYPGTGHYSEIGSSDGTGYTINAPLFHGCGEKSIVRILEEIFLPIAKQFKPDLIIFSSGYDSHHNDQLGGLNISCNFYQCLCAVSIKHL